MNSTAKKLYHVDGMDSKDHPNLYFSDKKDAVFWEDSLKFPMVNLHYQFSTGQIDGKILIDISPSILIHQLFSASDVFKDIIVLKLTERCMTELSKWQQNLPGAYDWTHALTAAAELEGTRDDLQKMDKQLKASMKQILKCDFGKENITSPAVLPLADCVMCTWVLDLISENKDEYMKNLEKSLTLLKPGGKLVLFGLLDATYIVVGGESFHRLKYDEDFVRDSLCKLGMVIDYCALQKRRNVSDLVDYSAVIFIVACKGK